MPFQSKSQQRMFFAKAKTSPKFAKMAHEWSHEGPEEYMKKLPKKIRGNKDRQKASLAHRGIGKNRTTSFTESVRMIFFPDE